MRKGFQSRRTVVVAKVLTSATTLTALAAVVAAGWKW
jgi:hypothetical protein